MTFEKSFLWSTDAEKDQGVETSPFDDLDVLAALDDIRFEPYFKFAVAFDDILRARVEAEGGETGCGWQSDELELSAEQRRHRVLRDLAVLAERSTVEVILDLTEKGPAADRGDLNKVCLQTTEEVRIAYDIRSDEVTAVRERLFADESV